MKLTGCNCCHQKIRLSGLGKAILPPSSCPAGKTAQRQSEDVDMLLLVWY